MRDLRLRKAARADLAEIWKFSRRTYSLDSALAYYNGLIDRMEALQSDIRLARSYPAISGLKFVKYGAHFIYFRAGDTRLEIVRVLHERRDQNKALP